MSGHSKWHNIRVRKGAQDARRGKIYTKFARLIEIAAREGGGDSTANVRLRGLIESAKAESVPNANIERAIKKGTGELHGEAMQEIVYEAYGHGGVALLIECLTDNRNRALSNVKLIVSKHGGRFAESGSVRWMFERRGVVEASKESWATHDAERDALELLLIDAGAEDIVWQEEGGVRILSGSAVWPRVRDFVLHSGGAVHSAGLEYVPSQTVTVDSVTSEAIERLVSALEDDDDVSDVHVNAVRSE